MAKARRRSRARSFRILETILLISLLVAKETAPFPRTTSLDGESRYLKAWMSITNLISMTCEMSDSLRGYRYERSTMRLDQMHMLVYSRGKYLPFAMSDAARAIRSLPRHLFDPTKRTLIYVHGLNGYPDAVGVTRIGTGVEAQGAQFLSFDCRKYITGYDYLFIGGLIKHLGAILGDFLVDLGVPGHSVYLVGLSLGAQIGSYAGKRFAQRRGGELLARLTALDPTAQCYSLDPSASINPRDAAYVDIVHTSVLSQTPNYKGHAEYYVNGRSGLQPGCDGMLDLRCSHARSLHLFGSTVHRPDMFPAKRCRDISVYDCQSNDISLMGFGSSPQSRGNYIIRTSGRYPFALGMDGIRL